MTTLPDNEIWITGIGLVSSLGEGLDAHWRVMAEGEPRPAPADSAPLPASR